MTLTARFRARLWLVLALCLLGGMIGTFVVDRIPSTPRPFDGPVFSADAVVHGATIGQWSARYWQWTVALPIGSNPGQDPTGELCGDGQEGPVFFVPSNFPPCEIPAGKIIFVPIVGAECSTAEAPPFYGGSETELRACARDEVDRYVGIIVRVDGELVEEIDSYRATSPVFRMVLPENNVLGGTPGVAIAVADGYQMLLAPLEPGQHELMVHVELADGTVLPDKVMNLTVA